MNVDDLLAEGFKEVGTFVLDSEDPTCIKFVRSPDAPRHRNVIYAFVDPNGVRCISETGRRASDRGGEIANYLTTQIRNGEPLSGLSWQLCSAIEAGGSVKVLSGRALSVATQKRKALENEYMNRFNTKHPNGWNYFELDA
jgi:hypothetical protein